MASPSLQFRFAKEDVLKLSSTGQSTIHNLLGTFLFLGYIVAALFFTGLITSDLLFAFKRFSHQTSPKSDDGSTFQHVITLVCFASFSFAILSFNMISFLLGSYQAKCDGLNLCRPENVSWGALGDLKAWKTTFRHIKKWMLHSTLFQDFAEMITMTPGRVSWTQGTLLLTMVWHRSMAIEGKILGINTRFQMV